MPVIQAWKAKTTIVMKRGMAAGCASACACVTIGLDESNGTDAEVPNPLFYMPTTKMLFGKSQSSFDRQDIAYRRRTGDAKASCDAIKAGLLEKPAE